MLDVAVPVNGPAGEHRNLTAGTTVCPISLVQVDTGPPLAPAIPAGDGRWSPPPPRSP